MVKTNSKKIAMSIMLIGLGLQVTDVTASQGFFKPVVDTATYFTSISKNATITETIACIAIPVVIGIALYMRFRSTRPATPPAPASDVNNNDNNGSAATPPASESRSQAGLTSADSQAINAIHDEDMTAKKSSFRSWFDFFFGVKKDKADSTNSNDSLESVNIRNEHDDRATENSKSTNLLIARLVESEGLHNRATSSQPASSNLIDDQNSTNDDADGDGEELLALSSSGVNSPDILVETKTTQAESTQIDSLPSNDIHPAAI